LPEGLHLVGMAMRLGFWLIVILIMIMRRGKVIICRR